MQGAGPANHGNIQQAQSRIHLPQMKTMVVLGLLTAMLVTGCATVGEGVDPTAPIRPIVDPAARKAELATLPPSARLGYCYGRVDTTAHMTPVARITGPIRRQLSNAQRTGNILFQNIAAWYGGQEGAAEAIRDLLSEGARLGAFTKLAPYSPSEVIHYNPMNEPVFQVANFMVPLAHAYAILEAEYPTDTALLMSVRQWGDRLYQKTSTSGDSFLGQSQGADRRVLIAAGWASTGQYHGQSRPACPCLSVLCAEDQKDPPLNHDVIDLI